MDSLDSSDSIFLKNRRFIKFIVVGAICTFLDFSIFYLLNYYHNYDIVSANIISYGIGLTFGFLMNRSWTFSDSENKSKSRLFLVLVLGYIGLILNTVLVYIFSHYTGNMYAKVLAVLIILIYNYLTNKHLVFKIK